LRQFTPGILLLVFFAALIGLGGAYVVKKSLQKPPPVVAVKPKEPVRLVILAAVDIPPGRVVHSGDFMNLQLSQKQFAARKWPPVMLADGKQIIGRTIKRLTKKGEPFEPDSFYPEGTGPDITDQIEPGLRAVTITVEGASAFPSQAMPGSLVDVIFRSKPDPKERIPEVTRGLMERVKILAVGNNSTPGIQGGIDPEADSQTVTLAVLPTQATILKVAEGHGVLTLVLRAAGDDSFDIVDSSLTLSQLLRIPPEQPPPQPFVAEVYRNGQRQTLTFKPSGGVLNDQLPPVQPLPAPPPVDEPVPMPIPAPSIPAPGDPIPSPPRTPAAPLKMNRVS
jgi:pilus assembly protein CpaB